MVVFTFFFTYNASSQPVQKFAEHALNTIVSLEMQDNNGKLLGYGSGFLVRPNLIVTNYHVIEGAAHGTAKLISMDKAYTIEGVTATDKTNDLALLQIKTDMLLHMVSNFKPLPLGDSDTVKVGEKVYVLGNPLRLEGTVSEGIISSYRNGDTKERIQMTAPISPGSSGGPVLNGKGEVIGVSVATHRHPDAQNINFAIPSKHLKTLLSRSGIVKPFSQAVQSISVDTYLLWAIFRQSAGDYETAIVYLDAATRLYPRHSSAYYHRGLVKSQLEKYSDAIADYDIVIFLDPDHEMAYYHRGIAQAQLGRYSDAIADYDIAIRLAPDHYSFYRTRGIAKANLGQHSNAIKDYSSAIHIKDNEAETYHYRGIAKANLGQYTAAIVDYSAAIRLRPDYIMAYLDRGLANADIGKYFAALDDYNLALHIAPENADAYYYRGTTKAKLGRYFAAITDYNAAIRLKPEFAKAYYYRGVTKSELGQHFAAITDYDITIRLRPNIAEAYYNRGLAKKILGSPWEAKQDLRTALKIADQQGHESLKVKIEELLQNWD